MRKLLLFVIAGLVIPNVALAKGPNPSKGPHGNKGKAKVQYVLKGTLSSYSAYDSSTSTSGSITIDVTRANRHARALRNMSLSFSGMITSSTRVVLRNGVTVVADNDSGIVKIRAPKEPKNITSSDLATILTGMPVRQIVDQGPTS